MKKRAFTLTELMVVISIIALLVMVVSPTLTTTWRVARRTLCQNNLAKLSTVLAQASGANFSHPNNISQITEYFPDWQMWPAQAFTAINDPAVFRCPEDDSPKTLDYSSVHKRVEFRSTYGGGVAITLATQLGDNYYYLGRTGSDPVKGKYTEYVFEEAGRILTYGWDFWVITNHNDGFIRIYEMTGELVVLACNCGGDNQLWIDNKPAFGPDTSNLNYTQLNRNVGKTLKLGSGVSTLASYGVNSFAHRYPYSSSVLVLMDYKSDDLTISMSADPDEPTKVREQLLKSLRHLGRLNMLKADGSVQTAGLSQIDPAQNRPLWNPKNLVPHADD